MPKLFRKSFYKEAVELLSATFTSFGNDKAMKMSAALAYYTVFSLAPLLLVVIWLVGFFFGEQASQGQVFEELEAFVGADAAKQIEQVIERISLEGKSGLAVGIGIGTLIAGSTTVFIEIQDSINTIWQVRPKPKKGWVKLLINRVLSFSMIIGMGFLLIVSLLVNTIILAFSDFINRFLPFDTMWAVDLVNRGITFVIIAFLFGVIFKFLPDARISWKEVRSGAMFTAVLFMLGQFFIGLYMQYAAPASAYGAAGSVIIVLLWIYYAAAILYFGAEFTKEYARKYGKGIQPSSYAVRIIQTESETANP